MQFEGHDPKPSPERLKSEDLVLGRLYFRVGYLDVNMVAPDVEVVVFIGRDLHPEGPGLYFQDVGSFLAGERFDPARVRSLPQVDGPDHGYFTPEMGDTGVDVYPERVHAGAKTFDEAIDSLLACSVRHRAWDGTLRPIPVRDDG
jgi:hypothetical protein